MRKEATLEMWKELYEITAKINELKPWEHLWDTDLISIYNKNTEDPIFCSIMGRGGSCYGISIYVGLEGLKDFNMIARTEELGIPADYAMFEQSNLSCYLGSREEVPAEQKKVIKDLNLKFRGELAWIYFVSYRKRYYPYIPDKDEVQLMIDTYKNLFMSLLAMIEHSMQVDFDHGETLRRKYDPKSGLWLNYKDLLPNVQMQYPVIELNDEVLKKRLKNQPKVDIDIILELAYMGARVNDKKYERPANPLLLMSMDEKTGIILDTNLLEPTDDEIQVVLNFFVNFIGREGRMKSIKARNPWIFSALQDICQHCGIKLVKDEIHMMDKALYKLKNKFF